MGTFNNPRKTAATATGSATLARGTHTPVDATSGAKTMTLPTNAPAGVEISVEKVDSSTNAVTVSGTLRGVASSTIALTAQYDARTFLSEGSGSWRPVSDHRTATSLMDTLSPSTLTPTALSQVARVPSDTVVYAGSWRPRPPLARSVRWVCQTNTDPTPKGVLPGDTIIRPAAYTPPAGHNKRHDGSPDQPNGVAVLTEDTPGPLDDGFTATQTGISTMEWSTAHFMPGYTESIKFATGVDSTASAYLNWSVTVTGSRVFVRGYVYFEAAPAASVSPVVLRDVAVGNIARMRVRTDMKLAVLGQASTELSRTTNAIPLNTWVRLEGDFTLGLTAGTTVLNFYTGEATTNTAGDSVTQTGVANGTATCTDVRFGIPLAQTTVASFWMAGFGFSDAAARGPLSTEVVDSGIRDSVSQVVVTPTFGIATDPSPTLAPRRPTEGVFASNAEIASLPISGNGYTNSLKVRAYLLTNPSPDMDNVDNRVGASALTGALLWLRGGKVDTALLNALKTYILAAPGNWTPTQQALNPVRSFGSLFAAVDLLMKAGVWDVNATCPNNGGSTWASWLVGLETKTISTGNLRWSTLQGTSVDSANNWGAVFRYALLMLGVIRNDDALVIQSVDLLRRYFGDTWKAKPFNENSTYRASWDNTGSYNGKMNGGVGFYDTEQPGRDGVVVSDVVRGGSDYSPNADFYGSTSSGLSYPLVAIDNVWAEVAVLEHLGYPARHWGISAVLRMSDWFSRAKEQATGNDVFTYCEITKADSYKNYRWYANRFRGGQIHGKPVPTVTPVTNETLPRQLPFGDWLCASTSTWMS